MNVVSAARGTELAALDRAHLIHPYLPRHVEGRVAFVRGDGARLWDADGREYLDCTGGLWLTQVGHGRRELAEVAAEQIGRLEYFTSFWDFTNDQAVYLGARLAELAPEGLDRVFLTSGGSEGNESAIKMARLYHFRRGEPQRTLDPVAPRRLPRPGLRQRLGHGLRGVPPRHRAPAAPRRAPDPGLAVPGGAVRRRGPRGLPSARAGGRRSSASGPTASPP